MTRIGVMHACDELGSCTVGHQQCLLVADLSPDGLALARPGSAGAASGLAQVVHPVDDRVLDRADALDLAADAVARLEEHGWMAEDPDA